MNIVLLDALTLGNIDLSSIESLGDFRIYDTTDKNEVLKRTKSSTVIITNKVIISKEVMDNAKNLKLICIAATGMNNVDLEYAKQKNIEVKNVVGYSTTSVATHTFSMLFYLLSSSKYYDSYVKNKEYEKSVVFTHLGREFSELSSKKWGIIGLGNIGSEVAKIASAFGCQVSYYSTSGENNSSEYKQVELEELLKNNDIISIHSPLNEKTKNLITQTELSLIKDGSFLLNLGRGGIVNEEDLANILKTKEIFIGFDVLENEPMLKTSPLCKITHLENVYISPHIAWASREARTRLIEKIAKNIRDYNWTT